MYAIQRETSTFNQHQLDNSTVSLTISSLHRSDAGTYRCMLITVDGEEVTEEFFLFVRPKSESTQLLAFTLFSSFYLFINFFRLFCLLHKGRWSKLLDRIIIESLHHLGHSEFYFPMIRKALRRMRTRDLMTLIMKIKPPNYLAIVFHIVQFFCK